MEHPPFFTVEEGRSWHDKIPGLHCKDLCIKDREGGIWLVVIPADKRADLGRLEKALGAPGFSFSRPELLQEGVGADARVGDTIWPDQRHATSGHRDS
jgi:Ala-tRNA(Pro) deacylase